MDNFYTTVDMLGAIETFIPAPSFFLDRYFKGASRISETRKIAFDEVLKGLPAMAPFVSPNLPATPKSRKGYTAKDFSPAYIKELDPVEPADLTKRRPGEAFGGSRTPAERLQQDILDTLELQKYAIFTRFEYMAARVLIDGVIKIEGENYPTQFVDFERSPDHTVVVTDPKQVWSNKSADISAQMENFSLQILSKTGYAATDVVMSPKVWQAFQNNEGVLRAAEIRRGVTNVPTLQPEAQTTLGAQYKGMFGSFSIFVYAMPFIETNGEIVFALGDNDVLFVAPPDANGKGGVEGIKAFGAIQDVEGLYPTDLFPKQWIEKSAGRMMLQTQSAPLMIPGRPNATLKATVM